MTTLSAQIAAMRLRIRPEFQPGPYSLDSLLQAVTEALVETAFETIPLDNVQVDALAQKVQALIRAEVEPLWEVAELTELFLAETAQKENDNDPR